MEKTNNPVMQKLEQLRNARKNSPVRGSSRKSRETLPENVGNVTGLNFSLLSEPKVFIYHDHVFTNLLAISEHFGKRHSDLIRAVENLECSSEFNERNFALVKYRDKKGEMRKSYRLTRDGFVFLVMGFTGKKAAVFKEAYIKRFNEMEQWLFLRVENKQIQDFFADAVKEYEESQPPQYRRPHAYAIENNLVYIAALGATKKQWLIQQHLPADSEIRNHLDYQQLQRVDDIIHEAMRLLKLGFLYHERKAKLLAFAKTI